MNSFYEPLVKIDNKINSVDYDKIAKKLGLKGYAILGEKYSKKKINSVTIEHISRMEIIEDKIDSVRKSLPNSRLKCELLSIRTSNDKVAQWVVKDNRVDILTIPISKMREIITEQLANVAATNKTFLEIDLSPIIHSKKRSSINIRTLTRVMHVILKQHAPFVFTMNVNSPYDFRDRRSILSIAKLLGVSEQQFKDSLILFNDRINGNRKKLTSEYIAPGIETISKESNKKKSSKDEIIDEIDLPLNLINLPIKEKKLERQRYLLFEILSSEDFELEQKELEKIIWENFNSLFGLVGCARLGLYIIHFDEINKTGILRCNHLSLSALRAVLAVISEIANTRILIKVLKVSGTIKSIKKEKK